MLLVYFSNNAWNTMYNISALMVVPAYITTTLYIAKICLNDEYKKYSQRGRSMALISGVLGALFCLFILYASSIEYVALVPILMTCGLPIFVWSRKDKNDGKPIFQKIEWIYLVILLLADIVVAWLFWSGKISI